MSIILTPDHHSVVSADKAKEICYSFFEKTGVTAFVYARIFDQGATFGLNTSAHRISLTKNSLLFYFCKLRQRLF